MKRGFYTGLAAALAFFALSAVWLLSASQSYRDASDLTQLQALRVSEEAQDVQAFLSSALADAESDAAFAAHGCLPAGGFCALARQRAADYTDASAVRLSRPGLSVRTSLFDWSCVAQPVVPTGFTDAYRVVVSLNVSLDGGPVKAWRWVNQSDEVWVNSSVRFRALVNSSGPAEVWDVRVNC